MTRAGRPAKHRGFTLLELLVVMFIVGIVAAMATLSIGVATSEKGMAREAERLADLIALASEEAVLQGREFGITFYARQYEFSAFDAATARWAPLTDDSEMFAPRELPPDTVLELEIDERIVKLLEERPSSKKQQTGENDDLANPQAAVDSTRDDDVVPQVFILSSGDMTPFSVRMQAAPGEPGIKLDVAESGVTRQVRDEK